MGSFNSKGNDTEADLISTEISETELCLENGQMREIELGGVKVLLIKQEDKLFSLSAKCPLDPSNESLIDGVLHEGRLRCSRHGSVFDIGTGDLIEHPGTDCLHSFKVESEPGLIRVLAPRSNLLEDSRVHRAMRLIPSDKRTIVIIGAGAAAMTCAETLRQEGFIGRLIVLANERLLRFDRINEHGRVFYDGSFPLRERKFYSNRDILFRDKEIVQINTDKNKVLFKDGDEINYYQLLIAAPAKPKKATMIPGYDLDLIYPVRSVHDLELWSTKGEQVVIVGASALGLQLADNLVGEARSVTVVDVEEFPLQKRVGREIGECVRKILEERGVVFHLEAGVKRFEGEVGGRLKNVVLKNGTEIDATICFTTFGDEPWTDVLQDTGIVISERNRIVVNKHMRTNKKNVFGAGECVEYSRDDATHINIQHWPLAQQQGRVAALNMLSKETEFNSVPYFWMNIGEHKVHFLGDNHKYDKVITKGSIAERKLITYFIKDDSVVGVACIGEDRVASVVAELLHHRHPIPVEELMSDNPSWMLKFVNREHTHGDHTHTDDVTAHDVTRRTNGCTLSSDSGRRTSTHF